MNIGVGILCIVCILLAIRTAQLLREVIVVLREIAEMGKVVNEIEKEK